MASPRLSLLLLLQTVTVKRLQAAGKPFPWKRFLSMFGLVIVYFYVMEEIGFYTSAFLFIIAVTLIFGRKRFTSTRVLSRAVISACFTGVIYILFNVLLKVQTPTGLLF